MYNIEESTFHLLIAKIVRFSILMLCSQIQIMHLGSQKDND